jgi:hypothetical protein
LTTVDLPWATCPMVPTLIVACLLITSGDKGVSLVASFLFFLTFLIKIGCKLV